jgi:hypothetical protein
VSTWLVHGVAKGEAIGLYGAVARAAGAQQTSTKPAAITGLSASPRRPTLTPAGLTRRTLRIGGGCRS